jgi:hypothetical protein
MDKVSNLDFFAHGVPGSVEFGYSTSQAANYQLNATNAGTIDPNAFGADSTPSRPDLIHSYACRTGNSDTSSGVTNETAHPESSLAQSLANTTNVTVEAFISRSDYSATLGTTADRRYDCGWYSIGSHGCDYSPALTASMSRRRDIDGATFDPNGAMHPVTTGTDTLTSLHTRSWSFRPGVTPVLPPTPPPPVHTYTGSRYQSYPDGTMTDMETGRTWVRHAMP